MIDIVADFLEIGVKVIVVNRLHPADQGFKLLTRLGSTEQKALNFSASQQPRRAVPGSLPLRPLS